MVTKKLVLIRHGESIWNQENRFTGWTDVALLQKVLKKLIRLAACLNQRAIPLTMPIHQF